VARCAVVLAAGLGTRMKSSKHKVLHEVAGKPMILHILDQLSQLHLQQTIVVVGQAREEVMSVVGNRAEFAIQDEQNGTGHALQVATPLIQPDIDTTLVLYGDAPLIQAQTMERLFQCQEQRQAAAVVLTASVVNPTGLGRILKDAAGNIAAIVEEKDANPEQRKVREINTGIYAFATPRMRQSLALLKADNAQGEYYLTDTIGILRRQQELVLSCPVENEDEVASVNNRVQLAEVNRIFRRNLNRKWMLEGVTIVNPDSTYIDADVTIGRDTIIYPETYLQGTTTIGEGCTLGPNLRVSSSRIDDGAQLEQSVVLESVIHRSATVGPFAYIRPGSEIGVGVKIGDFVEIKKSAIGDGTKVSHLAYVGDAEVGERVNVGCGAITVNYDGERKHRTVVGDDSFVGSNVNLIAPVTVGKGAYLCAGSTITDDVGDDGFAIGRGRQVTKPDYVKAWKQRAQVEKPNSLKHEGR